LKTSLDRPVTAAVRPYDHFARVRISLALLTLALAPLLAWHTAGAQAMGRVTGAILSESGQPVPSVQIIVVGTTIGAVSGSDGRYTINGVAPGTYQLRAQRLGFSPLTQQATVTAGETATVNFTLAVLPTSLAASVVVGYTTQQRRDVSDATASVSGAEIRDQKVATVDEALRGRIPGVTVAASGEPGRPAQVIVRGQNFVSGAVSPLYVVDGMYLQQNPNLNPDDIESIDVLKDASAAAQYGAQAANGVIVIRTRRGRGDNRFELRSYYGYQDIPKRITMMSSGQWAALTRQAYANAGLTPPSGAVNPTVNTDWQAAVFRTGAIQDHNLSMSGGSPTADYLISGGYLDQRGAIIETSFQRYSFRVNSEARRNRLTLGENVAISQSTRSGLIGFPLIDVVRMLPSIPVYDPANPGGYGYGSDANPTFGTNPVGALQANKDRLRSNQVIGTAYAEVALPANLRYRLNLGLNYDDYGAHNFGSVDQLRYRTPIPVASLTEYSSGFTSLLYEHLLTYDNSFGNGVHRVNAVAGVTGQQQNQDILTGYREGFTDESLQTIDAGQAGGQRTSGSKIQSALRALLFRANYSLKERYLLTGSLRRDCSSRFGPSNRCGNFAAASAGWVLSEESFFKGAPFLGRADFFKLRASTGVLGNQDIGNYTYSAPISQNLNYLFGTGAGAINPGATQLSLANPNIRWQSNHQSDIGLDLGMLDDRVTFTADYYVSTSDGLLVTAPLPWSVGAIGDPVINAGSVRNAGVELGLTHHYDRGPFHLNTSANLTTTKNRVLRLGNGNQPLFDNLGVARTAVGGPIGEFYVLRTAGVFKSQAEITAWGVQPTAQPGDLKFVDTNGDGIINLDDRYNAGNGIPKVTGGLFFDGRYGVFDFGLNLRGSWGSKIFNAVRYWTDRGDDPSNFRADYSPWSPTNSSSNTPRIVAGPAGAMNATYLSDRWIESGSFVRIQNLAFGYTVPSRYTSRLPTAGVQPRVYLNIQNLHTFTKFSNWDPETLGFGNPLGRGIDDGAIYPNVRTITIGLDLRM
jgi:TonB-linked SusC/RagA family outer membrane protein